VRETLARVGMAADTLAKLPGELSGGERQRVAVARALVLEPRLIVADEIVSMLDSCRKLEILDLLAGERDRLGLSVLLVTHDVAVAASVCDRIAVMSRGKIVEIGQTARVLADPRDPYTAALIDAVPRL
jgi:ABC-type oligopeptide transport system ATPase subunit